VPFQPWAGVRLHGRSAEGVFAAAEDLQQPHEAMAEVGQPPVCMRGGALRFNASALGGYACPLFARKFLAESAAAVLESAPYVWLRGAA
jgi:hypothetical protein